MSKGLNLFFTDVKEFFGNEMNRLFIAVILIGIMLFYGQVRTEKAIKSAHNYNMNAQKELMSEIKTNRDKVHFRYFNLTKSLEEIHNVKIDTKNGKLEK